MLKSLFEEFGNSSPTTTSSSTTPAADVSAAPAAPAAHRDVRATIPLRRRSCRARASTSPSRRRRPGTSSSISPTPASTTPSATPSACSRPTIRRSPMRVIAALGVSRDHPIGGRALRDVLINDVSLGAAPDLLFQLFSYIAGGERRQKAKALADGDDPDGDAATLDVLAAIEKFRGVRPDPEAFIEALDPLQPRLYSIASSPKVDRQPHGALRRYRPLRHQRPQAARRRLHLPRRAHRTPATGSRSMCRRRTPSACPPIRRCRSS